MKKLAYIFTFAAVVGLVTEASAVCRSYSKNYVSICNGKKIPSSKARGAGGNQFTCSDTGAQRTRGERAIKDFDLWADELTYDGAKSQAAFELRKDEPEINFNGQMGIAVYETWTWYDCVYGQNAAKCGTYQDCKNVPYSYTTTDSQGRTKTHSGTKRQCTTVAKSCNYDVRKTGKQLCSNETADYSTTYVKDKNWNPDHPDYFDFLPNKFDLLPGETETVQVVGRGGSTVSIGAQVDNAWNDYSIVPKTSTSFTCKQGMKPNVEFDIVTNKRVVRDAPNAFVLPKDHSGETIEPLVWELGFDEGKEVQLVPTEIRLADTSSAIVHLMSDNSKTQESIASPFYKNTSIRIQLVEDHWVSDLDKGYPSYISDSESVVSAMFSLSELQAIRNSDYWVIPLKDDSRDVSIYKHDGWAARLIGMDERKLKPNQRYFLRVSVAQEGIPFYTSDCKSDGGEVCDAEDQHYGSPVDFPFVTADYEQRGILQQLNEFTLIDWLDRNFFRNDREGL
jgi:hypothetical protein